MNECEHFYIWEWTIEEIGDSGEWKSYHAYPNKQKAIDVGKRLSIGGIKVEVRTYSDQVVKRFN